MKDKALSHGSWVVRFLKTQVSRLKSQDSFGFTLIELLVSITIIAVLSTVAFVAYSKSQALARDARRKQDLVAIVSSLELYFNVNKKYPPSPCGYGCTNYYYSTAGDSWIPGLTAGGFMTRIPVDPTNNANGPWTDGNYSYAYGNVALDGSSYDLTTQLENKQDPDRCEVKNWKWAQGIGGPWNWCRAFGGSYSNQIYEAAPDR